MDTRKIPSEIRSIRVSNATYHKNPAVIEPTLVNFFFGNNGTGKSTVARAVQNGESSTFAFGKSAADYHILVYDQGFIDRQIQKYHNLPGVFTINEINAEIQSQIDDKEDEKRTLKKKQSNAETEREEIENEITSLTSQFHDDCWEQAESLRTSFDGTQKGKKTKKNFAEAVLSAEPVEHDMSDLTREYESAYVDAKAYHTFSCIVNPGALDAIVPKELMGQAIVNTANTPFAQLMRKMGASEWARAGHDDLNNEDGLCPYCHQPLPENFESVFAESFDTLYTENIAALQRLQTDYRNTANAIIAPLMKIPDEVYPGASVKEYTAKLNEIKAIIQVNLDKIKEKLAEPAKGVVLTDTEPLLFELSGIISSINAMIQKNNDVISKIPHYQKLCTTAVFEQIAFILTPYVKNYRDNLAKATERLAEKKKEIGGYEESISILTDEIKDLSTRTVETDSAMDNINLMLRDSGFQGFKLRNKANTPHVYEVIREDGSVAVNLSEGEKNFIAFLYFYHLVRGSETEEQDGKEKIVVIDDPVSSMDSSVLFVVSALVREMVDICGNNADDRKPGPKGNFIKQIFILTHNAYFHREITYSYVEQYEWVSFFLIRKVDNISYIKPMIETDPNAPTLNRNVNPVKNEYAVLWQEYQDLTTAVPLVNVIRRILEHYFLQLCGYEGVTLREEILNKNRSAFITVDEFGNEDTSRYQAAHAMLSYIDSAAIGVNDGMNYIDECYDVAECRSIFEQIFRLMNQGQHYDKMMRIR